MPDTVVGSTFVAASPMPGTPLSYCSGGPGCGEISTHVISKLGKGSVHGAHVSVYFHHDFGASMQTPGWHSIGHFNLSANGAVDDLVPPGQLMRGLYLIEYDFSGVDSAARQIYRREISPTGSLCYTALNPTGFFLSARSAVILKVEDATSLNHVVLSVGDKELTVRPGVRAH
eukprot:CAMPEP_0119331972 /NCGR_PEP_ID=MMETSP1333-20130426/81762_1 /TAXON_ID=418940 /ORGANISM="Scyphosphaera apsteinii, Strain RCC1455" /LENGTH=172 /DNA_ID=CAMNT_0007341701 /DNA_START=166 /DNA_END=684 /DNA_ORIENTATION=-